MENLEQMKKNWRVLDENLQKTEIINKEQIKKITMEKIQTTFDAWRKKSGFSLITGSVVTLIFTIQWFIQGYIWQAIGFLLIMLTLIVLALMERKEIKSYTIYSLSTSELLKKVESLQLRKQREQLFAIPVIACMLFILTSIVQTKTMIVIGFIVGCGVAFVIGYMRMRRNFSKLRRNIQELEDLQKKRV